ncbi:Peptidase M23 [Chloroherpeton thalassium ATCC 35110]|uniref:Peptidase M23 n=1 Tax=Chloroherpeton thalassium (strain ATCC 35110 / GB-78) TaxID=517418 RepID=B3QUA6_CHLT3|nr:M23 family metallopeptidase [Chloroherpeton thalassium]ACF14355.1 Peptidase M23 [Chloroherpeton thalassium ATCC 35110]
MNNKTRFRYKSLVPIKLPFFGIWQVSQAQDGEYTHRGVYRYAWDFIIVNREGKQFKNQGDFPQDYFCYNKPVVAPEDGVVENVWDGVEDNIIGQVNLKENWGNTVIIKHDNEVYSKLCHLKKGSIKVKKGDEVKFGQIVGACGNSGRSPYPHLHFQMQAAPYIGSATTDYPLNNYIRHHESGFSLQTHSKPENGELVSNIEAGPLLVAALNFIPGQRLEFTAADGAKSERVSWEIKVNEFNQSYMLCEQTGAKAFFENDRNLFYFTYYEGDEKSRLFLFFQALFKLQKGFYQNMTISDNFPLYLTYPKAIRRPLDFISPFFVFIRSEFRLTCDSIDSDLAPSKITLSSGMTNFFFSKKINSQEFKIEIDASGISSVETFMNNRKVMMAKTENT